MALFRKKTSPLEKPAQAELDTTGMIDLPYLVLTLLLVSIGVLMMFSASYARSYYDTGNSAFYFSRQAIFALGGIAAMLLVGRLNYFIWYRLSIPILAVSALLLGILLIPGVGVTRNGATRWITVAGIEFQPSEVAKLGMILVFGALMAAWKENMDTFAYGVLPYVAIMGVLALLLVFEPHLSATVIIFMVGATMMLIGGTQKRWFVLGFVLAAGLFVYYISSKGYAGNRITAHLDPESDALGKGYQIIQSRFAIGSGGLLGLGFGKSRQKYLYLPEGHNDYIFAIVCEELGFVGGVGVILLFALLILRGYWIALHARDRFGTLVAAGLTTKLAIQVFFNIGVVTNFLPSTGISLPFFSYGGTALLLQMFEMGVVLSISRWCVNQEAWRKKKA